MRDAAGRRKARERQEHNAIHKRATQGGAALTRLHLQSSLQVEGNSGTSGIVVRPHAAHGVAGFFSRPEPNKAVLNSRGGRGRANNAQRRETQQSYLISRVFAPWADQNFAKKWGLSGRGSNLLKSDRPLTSYYYPRVIEIKPRERCTMSLMREDTFLLLRMLGF